MSLYLAGISQVIVRDIQHFNMNKSFVSRTNRTKMKTTAQSHFGSIGHMKAIIRVEEI